MILITGLTACGGGSGGSGSPTSPTGGGSGGGGGSTGPACRTYFTNENITTRTSGTNIVFNAIQSSNFDTSTKKATTQVKFANGSVCGTGVATYNSVADFVDEVRVIPPVFLAVGTTSGGGTLSYVYDDGARTSTGTSNPGNALTTQTFDANGNMISRNVRLWAGLRMWMGFSDTGTRDRIHSAGASGAPAGDVNHD